MSSSRIIFTGNSYYLQSIIILIIIIIIIIIIIMLSLTSVSASEDDIGDVADEFMPPCQTVHAMTVSLHGGRDSNRGRLLTSQPPRTLGHCACMQHITSGHSKGFKMTDVKLK